MTDKKIISRLVADPAGRLGCYLDPVTDLLYNMGASFKLPTAPEADAKPPVDLTHTKIKLADKTRGIVTAMGEEDDDFFCLVQTENNEEVKIEAQSDMKPLTAAEIKKWDADIEAAKAS
jgi:hypothetical protein